MKITKESKGVSLDLSEDEALVLLEWLSKLNEEEHASLYRDQAERIVLFDLEAKLEKIVSRTFEDNYEEILMKAWKKIRNEE